MLRFLRTPIAVFALAWLAAPAASALPLGTLEFTQRLGTATPDETIEVWMRFTLDPASGGLHFSSRPLTGFVAAELPTTSPVLNPVTASFDEVPIVPGSIDRATLRSWYACNTTFFVGCSAGGEYDFVFDGDRPGHPNPSGRDAFDLDPGGSIEYLLGHLVPRSGGAAPGIYQFFTVGLQLEFEGLGAGGEPLIGYHGLASTCAAADAGCAFTRVVAQAVPEPAGLALAAAGLGALAARRRRRGR